MNLELATRQGKAILKLQFTIFLHTICSRAGGRGTIFEEKQLLAPDLGDAPG